MSIHRLTEVGPSLGTPAEEIIAVLEPLLEQARRGELSGFGYFTVNGAGTVCHRWVSERASANDMVAGSAQLFYTVMHDNKARD